MEVLAHEFMQRALIAALLTGMIAPVIGTYIVQRRLSLLGDGLGHVAIAGVGLALMTGNSPIHIAIVTAVLGGLVIEYLRQHQKASGDVGLAILFYGGLAAGVFFSGMASNGQNSLQQYLFGALTTVGWDDLWVIAALAVLILIPCLGLAPRLMAVSIDEEHAATMGLRVKAYNYLIVALAALAVTLSMRTVGLLLVSALMVIPVATARNLVTGFVSSLWLASGLGMVTGVAGAAGSYYLDAPSGALIVLVGIGLFILSLPVVSISNRHRRIKGRRVAATGLTPTRVGHVRGHVDVDCDHGDRQQGA